MERERAVEILKGLSKEQQHALLVIVQHGAPETVGYSEQSRTAFSHGWRSALDEVYNSAGGLPLGHAAELAEEGYAELTDY